VLVTRLELVLRKRNLGRADIAERSGYTRQHFLRLRNGGDATRGGILAVTAAVEAATPQPVTAGMLFERADIVLHGRGKRLSSVHAEDRRALDALLRGPIDEGFSDRVAESGIASETSVRHLLGAAQKRLDRAPAEAAAIYVAAAQMGTRLPDTPAELAAALEAEALKGRANALGMLGRFDDALLCLAMAGRLFAEARYCFDEAGDVEYTRAVMLFKREHWDDALTATRTALRRFRKTGDGRRIARAQLLEANVLFEQGSWDGARTIWLQVRTALTALRDKDGLARVALNLGVCEMRRGKQQDARQWLNRARRGFRALKNDAELARTHWNMATYLATFETPLRAIRALRRAERAFLDLEMWVDAACVGLEITEYMVAIGADDEVLATRAQNVASVFVRAGLEVSLAEALEQLRNIARSADRRRVLRTMRRALRDAETTCTEIAVAPLGEAGGDPRPAREGT
jgi:tetratricopeptide (TPR) repeat protein